MAPALTITEGASPFLLNLFRKIRTTDRELDQVQTNVAQVLVPISRIEFMDGTILKNVVLTTGTNRIPHNLKRELNGWWLTRQYGAAAVYETSSSNLTLDLNSSADVTVDIQVF